EPGNAALAGMHSTCELILRKSRTGACFDYLARNRIFLAQRIIGRPKLGILTPPGNGFVRRDGLAAHFNSFARSSANLISRRGVFCDFLTKLRSTTTRLPFAVT